ncbi:hypothetical protein AB0I98_29655 [Streptomyces sp. NPDC050211]|uniref:hypothetical protein n=1 Tax=Streptomyces sp. NPDC050211 TaxID=3154932 RepID=UPI00342BD1C1
MAFLLTGLVAQPVVEFCEQTRHPAAAGEHVRAPVRREVTGQVDPLDAVVDDMADRIQQQRWQIALRPPAPPEAMREPAATA